MSDVVIENIMLLPLLIMTLILFPIAANSVVVTYISQQNEIVAQSAMNQIVSTVQQLYYSLNREDIMACNITMAKPFPQKIGSYEYYVDAKMNPNSLTLSLSMPGMNFALNKTISLSSNALWIDSQLRSTSPSAAINAQKLSNGTLVFNFG